MTYKKYFHTCFIFLPVLLSSCGFLGVHLKVHNPKKAGRYPKETKQLLLLGAKSKYRDCYDVKYYRLDIELMPDKKALSGRVDMMAYALSDIDTFQLDLYPNMAIEKLYVTSRGMIWTPKYRREAGAVFIEIPDKIKNGDPFMITTMYNGKPQIAKRPPWDGGFTWKKDKKGNPWIGVSCESEGASLWWPCKDDVADEPDSVYMSVTVPKGLTAVSNGNLLKADTSGFKNTFAWAVSYPINNYNVTLYAGNLVLVQDEYKSGLTGKTTRLNHYVLPENAEKAKTHFQQVKKHMAFYEKMFGEYPWQRDGFKLVESPYAGMEHQSAIAYGNGYKNDYGGIFDYIILHETAHEWWGNSVTAADLADGWIHEGFASYCEALYVESILGKEEYTSYMFQQRITIRNKRPVVRKRGIRYFDYHDEDIYTKGSWVLHTLRTVIDDDALFFDILKTFRTENHQKQILSEVFIDLVNRKTGKDYNWFFKQYLFKREAPILEFCRKNDRLYYRWKNTGDDFVMPVKLLVQNKTITLVPTAMVQSIELDDRYDFYDNSTDAYYGMKVNKKLVK